MCGVADDAGEYVIYCEWFNSKNKPEIYHFNPSMASKFILIPEADLPNLDKYKAEVLKWVDKKCR